MNNKFKSPLYFYIETQLKSKNVAYIGGQEAIQYLIDLITEMIDNCCTVTIDPTKVNSKLLKDSIQLLKDYSLPYDLAKLKFIKDKLLTPFLNCCT